MKKFIILGVLSAFMVTTTIVYAENVFTTQRGTKYHKEICRLIKNKTDLTELDKEEAVGNDYGPCKRCFKEDAVIEDQASTKTPITGDGS